METLEWIVGQQVRHKGQGPVTIQDVTDTHFVLSTKSGDSFRVKLESAIKVLSGLNSNNDKRLKRLIGKRQKEKTKVMSAPLENLNHPFCAIDFETANFSQRDSACAIGIVRVENREVVGEECFLIQPPSLDRFENTHRHGITKADVENEPLFPEIWEKVFPLTRGISFFAAHNAPWDQGVLYTLVKLYSLAIPEVPFKCTVQVARKRWNIRPTTLPDVCKHLGIPLRHHDPLSDAHAAAAIVLAA